MKYSVLLTAVLALVITACDKKDDVAMAPSDQVTPDQATPVTPAAPAAPVAEAPAPAAPEPQSAAPAASETSPAATESAAPAAAQGTALSLEEGHALGKKSGCFACHNIERKIIGPAWNDVGTKYKDNPAAHESLTKWVHTGGTGRWGTAVMPPYSPRVSDADIEKLVDFILSLPKSS
ncbi:MAG: c-type cytochrome [Gammaproteobacteria bacterium]